MSDHTITIGDMTFDRVDYDRDADVHVTVPQVVDVQREQLKLALA